MRNARNFYDDLRAAMHATWRDQAACAHHEPLWWDDANEHNDDAIRICKHICTVTADCLADAMRFDERATIRGGIPADKRMEMKSTWNTDAGSSYSEP